MRNRLFGFIRGMFGPFLYIAILSLFMVTGVNNTLVASEIQNLSQTTIGDPQLDKAAFAQKTKKLQIPFIANNGQVDDRVKFYANTFGGTVFVTKDGVIVYALPNNSSEVETQCLASSMHSPNGRHNAEARIQDNSGSCIVDCASVENRTSDIVHTASCIVDQDSKSEFQNPKSGVALREEFVGSRIKTIQGEDPSVTKVNYFKGNNPEKWKTDVSTYDFVNLGEIYKGIELKLKAYGDNVEKLFCVKPGASPDQIQVQINGGKSLKINDEGQLVAETEVGPVKFTKPVAYQEINGKRVDVSVEYRVESSEAENKSSKRKTHNSRFMSINPKSTIQNLSPTSTGDPKLEYGFKVASYDRTKDLIIDPLLASTFLGGSGSDYYINYGNSFALDTSGNVYVTVMTDSTDFPTTSGAYDTSYNGGNGDVFVSKLNSGLTSLLASTFLGGSGDETGYSLALDTSGNVYVTGRTPSTNFPTTSGAYDTSHNGSGDVFVSKLNSGLTSLLASTYLGGSGDDGSSDGSYGYSLVLDTSGNVYVTGTTGSTDFPTTSGAYDTSFNGSSDVFLSKLNGGLTSLLASTYLGGSGADYGYSFILDTSGSVYVTGWTYSTDFPVASGAYDTSFNGSSDVFVSKLNSRLTSLLASTYLGGPGRDYGDSLALDTSGNVYVTGFAGSGFPVTSEAYDTSYNGGSYDVFVSKLDGNLSATPSDTTAPSGSISINSGASYTNSSTVTLTLSATDSTGVTGYYISDSSTTPTASASGWTSVTSTTSYSATVSYSLSGGEGSKTIYAWYKDTAGNVSSTANATITLDTTVPTVTISSPTSSSTYTSTSSTISLGGSASDSSSGISSVAWSNNRGGNGTATGTASWTVSSISLSSGDNVITVTAKDGANNFGTDTLQVTYGTSSTVSVPTVSTGSASSVTTSSATLSGTVNANGGTTTAWFQYGTTSGSYGNTSSTQTVTGSSNTTVSIGISGLSSGTTYYYRVAASNSGGTSYGSELSFTTSTVTATPTPTPSTGDSSAPTDGSITINSGASYTNSTGVTLALSAKDSTGVTGYYLSQNSSTPSSSASGWTSVSSSTSYSGSVSYTLSGSDGNKTVYVWYKDAAGNVSSSASDDIALDTTSPTINITSPTSDATYTATSSTISLGGSASDSTSGIKEVTWTNSSGGSGTASGTTSWTISSISLSNGDNIITVTAKDNGGNTAVDTITVTYKSTSTNIPKVSTGSATNVTESSATLSGTVNANGLTTTALFNYGTNSGSYTNTTPTQTIIGSSDTAISININGLSAGTKYYYKLSAQNSAGTSTGSESSFTTKSLTTTPTPGVTPLPTLPPFPTPQVSPSPSNEGIVFGFVNDEDELPLKGITITITGKNSSDSTETDENGYYEFSGLSKGNYTLTYKKEGFLAQTLDVSLEEGELKDLGTVTMEQAVSGKIYGYVVNIKGDPIEFARLKLKGIKTKVTNNASTDADGFFEFADLEADTYVIVAKKKKYRNTQQKVVLEEGVSTEIEIVMKKTSKRIKGLLLEEDVQ